MIKTEDGGRKSENRNQKGKQRKGISRKEAQKSQEWLEKQRKGFSRPSEIGSPKLHGAGKKAQKAQK